MLAVELADGKVKLSPLDRLEEPESLRLLRDRVGALLPRVDLPDVLAEVRAVFARYEVALMANDVAALDALFWTDSRTIRYGVDENLYGIEAIRAFRSARPATGLARTLERTNITTFGRDTETASTLYRRTPGKVGRQMQTWARICGEWRVVAAHVSAIDG